MLANLYQLGPYTFFVTGSAADFHWPELIQIVVRQHGEYLTAEQRENMNWQTKQNRLKRNPLTVTRQINYTFPQVWTKVIICRAHHIEQIHNYEIRTEMQGMGTRHSFFYSAIHIKKMPQSYTKMQMMSV